MKAIFAVSDCTEIATATPEMQAAIMANCKIKLWPASANEEGGARAGEAAAGAIHPKSA